MLCFTSVTPLTVLPQACLARGENTAAKDVVSSADIGPSTPSSFKGSSPLFHTTFGSTDDLETLVVDHADLFKFPGRPLGRGLGMLRDARHANEAHRGYLTMNPAKRHWR